MNINDCLLDQTISNEVDREAELIFYLQPTDEPVCS